MTLSDPLKWRRRVYALAGLCFLLASAIVLATTVGSAAIPVPTVVGVLLGKLPLLGQGHSGQGSVETIILSIRLPRVILAGVVGAALATSGAAYQGLFRNPLADPYLIGVAQGAALGAVVGFLLPWSARSVPLLAFCGALLTVAAVYLLSRTKGSLPVTTLILAGVALGAFLSAVTSFLILKSQEEIHGILFWLLGGFSLSDWSEVRMVLPYVVVGLAVLYTYSRGLNALQLDEEQAQQLGINVERLKLLLLTAATLSTAAAVSFVGVIGFVGIIVPHAVRLLWGPDYRFLLPLSTLAGAIFLILADVVARTALAPLEIPAGVVTAFCGTPFFLYLLHSHKRMVF